MKYKGETFRIWEYGVFVLLTAAALVLCVSIGSVSIPFSHTVRVIWNTICKIPIPEEIINPSIISSVRLPRVLCAGLIGASLSLCGGAMQGLLKNPLADGSTLGVSSGASLGAVIAIIYYFTFMH